MCVILEQSANQQSLGGGEWGKLRETEEGGGKEGLVCVGTTADASADATAAAVCLPATPDMNGIPKKNTKQ